MEIDKSPEAGVSYIQFSLLRKMNIRIIPIILLFLIAATFVFPQSSIDEKIKNLFDSVESSTGKEKISSYINLIDYLVKTRPTLAIETAEQAIEFTKKFNDRIAEAKITLAMGWANTKLHEPKIAAEYYSKSYKMAEDMGDSSTMCKALIRLGAGKIAKDGIHLAIEDFIKVENIARKTGDNKNIIDAINFLAISYYMIDDYDDAIRLSENAIELSLKESYKEGLSQAYEHIAIVKIKQEKFDEALSFNSRALKLREELDDLSNIAGIYYNFAVIYSRTGKFDLAVDYTKKSIEIRTNLRNIKGVGSNLLTLGNIFLRSNQPDSALVYLKKAYDIKIGSGDTRAITSIVKSLAEVYEIKGDFKNAYGYLRDYKIYSDSLFGEDSRRLSSKILAQQENVRKQNEIEHLQSANTYQEKLQNFLIVIIVLVTLLTAAIVVLYIFKRKANKKLSDKNQELISLNKDREKFFSIITHDLRSPFHPIIGYSDIVINDINKLSREEIKDYITNIHLSAQKIHDLLDNMLQWLGLNTGKMDYKPSFFNLSEEIESTLKLFSNNIANKSIKLINEINQDINVYADRPMVGVIIRNLISNAIKFTRENGSVILTSTQKNNFAEIAISDNGVGIPPERLPSILSGDVSSTKGTMSESGTGLGLMLCKEMTERNGGELTVESIHKEGTTIIFTLPLIEHLKNNLLKKEKELSV